MKANKYQIRHSLKEQIAYVVMTNGYVQLAILVALGIAAGWLTAMVNAAKWGMM